MSTSTFTSTPTLYFGYGSNLWLHQMATRCPTSQYQGIARLAGYKWLINDRGYANVVETRNDKDKVYGLVYTLSPLDESRLDKNEGVPYAYTKEMLDCTFWAADANSPGRKIDTTKPPTATHKSMLVYIDRKRVEPATPRDEYVYRMNRGIEDAVKCGVPESYVRDVMRVYIPADEEGEREKMAEFARGQAAEFRDESGAF